MKKNITLLTARAKAAALITTGWLCCGVAAAQTADQTAAPRQVFIYSPAPQAGLHLAVKDNGAWRNVGQLCSSDYGTWGAEKHMHHPSVTRAKDGSWRLVFQVNDRAPLFAAAYSRDLVNWRPQDYPIMTTSKCLEPVVFENPDGTFDIYYKSPEGKRWTSATPNFRNFTPDRASQISDDAWIRDTATVVGRLYDSNSSTAAGRLYEGYSFDISPMEWAKIDAFFQERAHDARLSAERMHDDNTAPTVLSGSAAESQLAATLTIDPSRQKAISPDLIGIFFEDISYAADGGLYAELIQNRDFEYNSRDRREWSATTAWHARRPIEIATKNPLSKNNPHYALLWPNDTLWNEGWDGIAVEKGKKYDFSMYVLGGGQKQDFMIQLVGDDGTVLAKSKLKTAAGAWTQYSTVLTAKGSNAKARLAIVPLKAAHVGVDMISLFPQETFMNRKNGLRKDLAQVIADLKPKFMRFPGGCMSHGQGIDNIYHWQETIGPLQDRKPDFNIWHYHQTRGLGFYEYFQFCEDIGAEPLPVLAAGVPCQNSVANAQGIGGQQGGIPMDDMPAYIQELLNLIEWANGDPATSEWAKKRADAGHPAPFNLKYIGIGNEDIISTVFEERFTMIARAIRAKYPDIKICGTVGPFHSPSADYQEGWDFTRRNPDLQYMVDEHYYESTGWFMHHRDYYDHYPRTNADGTPATKVYLGEWAASTKTKRPNIETALAEALYLTDIERNGDIVVMTSYAPMLAKDGHHNWNPDMIYFSNTDVRPTPAYHVQRLFSVNSGDTYINSQLTIDNSQLKHRLGASVVKDSKTGHTYLKLVNALPSTLHLTVKGLNIPADAPTEGFHGQPTDQQLVIETGKTDSDSAGQTGNTIALPPYSFRVIKL